MAAPPRILALNLGSQTIRMAEFQVQPHRGLILRNFRLREILPDQTDDQVRRAQVATALREMMSELGINDGDINLAVPGQAVFTRFVKLPSMAEEKIERIVGFEAQQNVPFPLNEVIWDYQLLGNPSNGEIQVMIVAIKSNLLDEMNDPVEDTKLRTRLVDVGPMALYNAFRYNYCDLRGCSIVVDLGARTTDIFFVDQGKFFSRSVPFGGGSITAAIAKEFAEPLAAAELRKKRDGYINLGADYANSTDGDRVRVSRIVRNNVARLHAELARSISHYRYSTTGKRSAACFPQRRRRKHSLPARISPREAAIADRVI